MDFDLSDDQRSLAELATSTFARLAGFERVAEVEVTADRFDRTLWQELARTGLLAVAVDESHGGLGLGTVEVALVVEAAGRAVAPVPMLDTVVAALALTELGSDEQRERWLPAVASGEAILAVAAPQSAVGLVADSGVLSGSAVGIAWAHIADRVLLPVGDRLWLVDPAGPGVVAARGLTTGGQVALDLALSEAPAEPLGAEGAAAWLRSRWLTALTAQQAGGCDGAVRLTASYTSQREQFGKPLSAFQGVALKAADAYVDAAAIRAVALQAAWSIDAGVDPTLPSRTAAWWAAEAGQRCVHITQHLHGGMGADVTYPVHRFFLQGKQIELLVGGASAALAELADALAVAPHAGDNLVLQ